MTLRKGVSWAGHFGNIFMESSVMADILNRSNFHFTLSFSFGIRLLSVSKNNLDILLQFSRLIDD